MHSKARKVLGDLSSTNQGNGSKITFVAGLVKSTSKNSRPSYDRMT